MSTVTDSFNRADSTTSLGNADTGQSWSSENTNYGISSNAAYEVLGTAGGVVVIDPLFANVVVSSVMSVLSDNDYTGIVARYVDTANYYLADSNSAGALRLWRQVAGTYTQLGSAANGSMAAGDSLELHVIGSDLTVKVNGVTKISTVSDSSLTAGTKVGLRIGTGVVNATRWDSFSATSPGVAHTRTITRLISTHTG